MYRDIQKAYPERSNTHMYFDVVDPGLFIYRSAMFWKYATSANVRAIERRNGVNGETVRG